MKLPKVPGEPFVFGRSKKIAPPWSDAELLVKVVP